MAHYSTEAPAIAALLATPYALWQASQQQPEYQQQALVRIEQNRVTESNHQAAALGIVKGMSLAGARARSDTLVIIDTPAPQLEASWQQLLADLSAWTIRLESPSRGLVFLELSADDARTLAQHYQVQGGLASSPEEAHLLALSGQPGKLCRSKAQRDALALTQLAALGLSPATIERLSWLGLSTWGQLTSWSGEQLRRFLGPEYHHLQAYLKPQQRKLTRYRPAPTLEASYNFDSPVMEPALLDPVLALLASQLVTALGKRAGTTLTLSALAQGLKFSASRVAKQALRSSDQLYHQAQLALTETGVLGLEIDSLSLHLSGLYLPGQQGQLWQSQRNIQRAIEVVGQRFPEALFCFEQVNPYLPLAEFAFTQRRLSSNRGRSDPRQKTPQDRQALRLTRS